MIINCKKHGKQESTFVAPNDCPICLEDYFKILKDENGVTVIACKDFGEYKKIACKELKK